MYTLPSMLRKVLQSHWPCEASYAGCYMARKVDTLFEHVVRIGSLGGHARAAALTDEERSESARHAGLARAKKLSKARRVEIAKKASAAAAAKRKK